MYLKNTNYKVWKLQWAHCKITVRCWQIQLQHFTVF